MANSSDRTDSLCQQTPIIQTQQEYEYQYFGFSATSFSDGVYNAVIEYLHDTLDETRSLIASEFGSISSEEELSRATENIISACVKGIDIAFDKLQTHLLINTFCIKPNVLLPEDAMQEDPRYTKHADEALDLQIGQKETQITNALYVNAVLKQRIQKADNDQAEYNDFLNHLTELRKICENSGVQSLKEQLFDTTALVRTLANTANETQAITETLT